MNKKSIILSIVGITIFFISTYCMLNYKFYTGKTIFVAGREGGIYNTKLILKGNNTFVERIACLSNQTTRGTYKFTNDTIYFESYHNDKHKYTFGLITESIHGAVINLYDEKGTFENQFYIDFNELNN